MAIFDETDYVRARRRLLGNPRPQHAKQNPADARNKGSLTESRTGQQKDRGNNEESGDKKTGGRFRQRAQFACHDQAAAGHRFHCRDARSFREMVRVGEHRRLA